MAEYIDLGKKSKMSPIKTQSHFLQRGHNKSEGGGGTTP